MKYPKIRKTMNDKNAMLLKVDFVATKEEFVISTIELLSIYFKEKTKKKKHLSEIDHFMKKLITLQIDPKEEITKRQIFDNLKLIYFKNGAHIYFHNDDIEKYFYDINSNYPSKIEKIAKGIVDNYFPELEK